MITLLIAFFISFFACSLIIKTQKYHGSLSGDNVLNEPQKFHTISVPRIGGAAIALGIFSSIAINYARNLQNIELILFIFCALPVFGIGLSEDIFKKISIRTRLFFTAVGAFFATIFLKSQISTLDIPGIDIAFSIPVVSIGFTIFAVTGLSHAYNIIDGLNGLASMVGIITLLALGYMGFKLNDSIIMLLSLAMASAILGFFILNYPRGLIFLGDGGAYLIGFWIAVLSILLIINHHEISPWFAVLINIYPVVETLFTIFRRQVHQGKNPGHPDGIHLHSLIYRRLFSPKYKDPNQGQFKANSDASPYLWVLSSLGVIPAVLFFYSTQIIIIFIIMFLITYLWLYKKIVTFQTPRWMHQ